MNLAIDLVIFDCDGVLVDSEVISCRAHAEILTRHGYPITPEQMLERFLGVSDREARQTIETEICRKLPDDFEAQMKQAALRCYADDLPTIPHVGAAIAAIGLPKCVASSGTPDKIRHGLTCAGLYDLLAPSIFSASQVERGKPAPDLFLFAAAQMRTAPARCIVIEDSIPGITGALAAGMNDHLINLRDGKVIEFTSEEIEKLQAEIARKLGYKLVDHRLELYCVPLDDDKS